MEAVPRRTVEQVAAADLDPFNAALEDTFNPWEARAPPDEIVFARRWRNESTATALPRTFPRRTVRAPAAVRDRPVEARVPEDATVFERAWRVMSIPAARSRRASEAARVSLFAGGRREERGGTVGEGMEERVEETATAEEMRREDARGGTEVEREEERAEAREEEEEARDPIAVAARFVERERVLREESTLAASDRRASPAVRGVALAAATPRLPAAAAPAFTRRWRGGEEREWRVEFTACATETRRDEEALGEAEGEERAGREERRRRRRTRHRKVCVIWGGGGRQGDQSSGCRVEN